MSSIEEKIIKAGFSLPQPPAVAGLYSPAIRSGNLVFTSGQLPLENGKLIEPGGKGKVNDQGREDAFNAARTALLNALAAIKSVTGTLDCIERIVKLTLYVASDSGFSSQHLVANGASSLLLEIFEERGVHARSAVGVAELPLDASLEIELVVQCDFTSA
ncbi:RidA family protein [Chlorobium ferrooxidans]|uniref:Endoribonuclease L-PSP n=1 Tax=Chlorobium ferrooxidans DSM 13031 TaxID=377431 RepID=Q0YT10_9CHLB|nr:RidA family protein [Chlorobium ferrooxidans]EAT59454.1 Endoribonuclease L-PSP [Chlorobium ferrooxidans DSM 13031]